MGKTTKDEFDDEPYIRLWEAVIEKARQDYVDSANYLINAHPSFNRRDFLQSRIAMFLNCRRFLATGCNGLLSPGEKSIIDKVDRELGINYEEIDGIIRYYENRYMFVRSYVEIIKETHSKRKDEEDDEY